MDVQKEISLRNAISYCIENNDVNTATNRIMEFIRDGKEALNIPVVVLQSEQLPTNEELEKRWKDLENRGLDKPLEKWD
jgi:hypothetical protein